MAKSRTEKSFRNIIVSFIYQFLLLIFNFLTRTVFIQTIGIEYLGINGLFTNIFTVLSLAELGIGSAMIYSMYRPLAMHDEKKLSALSNYFKSLYHKIAIFIFILGLMFLPFLPYLINLDTPLDHIPLYYILFLLDTVSSYLFIYKTSIITADQKDYIIKVCNIIGNLIRFILQILVLYIFHSFFLYLAVKIIISFFINWYSARLSIQLYPSITEKNELEQKEKKEIWSNVRSLFSYKLGGVILNNTDQLLISVLVATEAVGYYSNYKIIISALTGITSMFFISLQSSIGNLNAESNHKQQYYLFNKLNICSFWIYGFSSICLCLLLQDFIQLWLGNSYLLNESVVYATVAIYYSTGVLYPIWNFRETVGLFKYTKNILFYAALINLILSFILGRILGIFGILLATVIARILTNMWFEPYVLCTVFFKKSPLKYYVNQILGVIYLILIILTMQWIFGFIMVENVYLLFFIKIILCMIIPNLFIYLALMKNPYFKILKTQAITLLNSLYKGEKKYE